MARPRKYPWSEWFAMEEGFTIEPGEDGVSGEGDVERTLVSMRAQVHAEAQSRGLRVTTRLVGDAFDGDIVLQVVPSRASPRQRQHWQALFDGEPRRLVPGRDFRGSAEDFVSRAHAAALDRQIDLRCDVKDGAVRIRAFPDGDPRPLHDFFEQLPPGEYRATRLLEEAMRFQGAGTGLTPRRLAALAQHHGLVRHRSPRGSVWTKL